MKLRDYQTEAVDFLIARKRGMVVAPAGSGKTIIGAAAVARVVHPGQKVVWIGNTQEQISQAGEAVSRVPGPENVDLQIACAASEPDTSDADIIVLDECHHLPAVGFWLPRVTKANPNAIIFGLTATPWHDDEERNKVVRETFREFHTIDRARILASGHLVPGKVYFYDIDKSGEFDASIEAKTQAEVVRRMRAFQSIPRHEHERRAKWQFTQEAIQQNEARNSAAVALAKKAEAEGESTIILVFSIEHGEKLVARIPGAVMAHSKLGKKRRAQILDDFRNKRLHTLVATSLMDEGADVPVASVLILVAGGRAAGKTEQRIGRILRPAPGKTGATGFDFLDRGAVFAYAQARARFRTYEGLGYSPEIIRP